MNGWVVLMRIDFCQIRRSARKSVIRTILFVLLPYLLGHTGTWFAWSSLADCCLQFYHIAPEGRRGTKGQDRYLDGYILRVTTFRIRISHHPARAYAFRFLSAAQPHSLPPLSVSKRAKILCVLRRSQNVHETPQYETG